MKPVPTEEGMLHRRRYVHAFSATLILVAVWVASLLLFPYTVSAEDPTATTTATPTATQAPPRFFSSQLQVKPLSTPVGPLQDVQGRVIAKTGVGIDGVRVRASSRDWQAFETTRDGGKFSFSLTNGSYAIQLVDMVSGAVDLTVDGKSELQIQFNEVDRLFVSSTATPTMASPTATATARQTATPSATPNPTSTPAPLPETIGNHPEPEVTPAASSSIFPFPVEIDPAPWLQVFLYGAGLGGAIVFFGLLLAMVRRL